MALSNDAARAERYRKLFKLFDAHHDGAIDAQDFATIEERVAAFLPGAKPAPDEVAFAARLRLTQFRKADSDKDRKVTEEEWLAHCERAFVGAKALDAEGETFARAFFRTLDVNRDNAIDFGDFAYAHLAHGLNPTVEQLHAGFRALDANNTGKVSLQEFMAAYTRYVTGDADAPELLVS